MERNKKAILASGIDPNLKRLRKLQAIKSGAEKSFTRSCERIEDYWDEVFGAIADKQKTA